MLRRLFVLSVVALSAGCGGSYGGSGGSVVARNGSVGVDAGEPRKGFTETAVESTSTVAADVDTGSYTLARRALLSDKLPVPEEVRPEEFLNFFDYDYPQALNTPLAVSFEAAPSPFGQGLHLLRIGVQAKQVPVSERKSANLVFLIDVSGSMQSPDKLGLVKFSLKELVKRLEPTDTIGIVTYAGGAGVALEPTPVAQRAKVLEVIDNLTAGGGTAGEAGIRGAYALAEKAKRDGGINRVILCTDGDFNIGVTGDALISLIENFRSKGVFLTTLGFGTGNYKDAQMEKLADHGNGQYAYIDGPGEAVRVLGTKLVSTLEVVAKDVKIQVEFNGAAVKRYRLIGYENRRLANADFANDLKDAGELGAGHTVTALYEVELISGNTEKLGTVRIRQKPPEGDVSTESSFTVEREVLRETVEGASADFRFAAAVAELGEILSNSTFSSGQPFAALISLAEGATKNNGDRLELVSLARKASVAKR